MKKKKAFTLVELMVVVVIVGVLTSISIPSFLKFINQSKISEAILSIRALTNGSVSWFNEEHSDSIGNPLPSYFPHDKAPTWVAPITGSPNVTRTPTPLPCQDVSISKGAMYLKNTARWTSQPWQALRFSLNKSHYFRYTFSSFGTNTTAFFEAVAEADLDCNSLTSIYKVEGAVESSSLEPYVSELIIFNGLE